MSYPARRRGGDGGGAIPAGLRLNTAKTRGETDLEREGSTWMFSVVSKTLKTLSIYRRRGGRGLRPREAFFFLSCARERGGVLLQSYLETLSTLCFFLLKSYRP